MTDSGESVDDLLARLVEDFYLDNLAAARREPLVEQLNARIDGRINPHEFFNLLLVVLECRPACLVGSNHRAITREHARALAEDPAEATLWDPLGQFLDHYDIPFELCPTVSGTHGGDVALVALNYYISLDRERLADFAAAHTITPGDDLCHADDRRIGEFLGYPAAAIDDYCDEVQMREGHLLETIDEAALADALGGVTGVYDRLELDYRAFTKCLCPYVVASTSPDCLDRIVTDVLRAVAAGIVARDRYSCTVFNQVVSDYNRAARA